MRETLAILCTSNLSDKGNELTVTRFFKDFINRKVPPLIEPGYIIEVEIKKYRHMK